MFIRITCLTIGLGLSIPAQAEPVRVSEPILILAPTQHVSFRELDRQALRYKEREPFLWQLSDFVQVGQIPAQPLQTITHTSVRNQQLVGISFRVSF